MTELDDATIRTHLRRRAGGPLEQAQVDGLTRSITARLDEQPRSLPRLFATAPLGARVGVAAALVVAVSLIAVPLAGGPKASTPPSAGTATEGSAEASTSDPNVLQILSLAELQRVASFGATAPYRDHLVVADVELAPTPLITDCVPDACPIGQVVGASPTIQVIQPTKDIDTPTSFIPAALELFQGGSLGPFDPSSRPCRTSRERWSSHAGASWWAGRTWWMRSS
jgi:hypothetical protein